MSVDIRGEEALNQILFGLEQWTRTGHKQNVDKAAKEMAADYTEKILTGRGADGKPLAPLKKSTLDGPVRREGATEIRNIAHGDVPMKATGKTARGIRATQKGVNTWEITSATDLGDKILHSNANTTHHGGPFAGDTPKVIRDPVQVTEVQWDIVEKILLDGIDRALNG
jgi:hypothetical protein